MPKTITTEYGEYRPLSQRIPTFLDAFPPSDGFGIEIEVKDSLALRPGLLDLYRSCIEAGRNPREVGLPPFPSANSVIFIAKLVRDGVVLCTASTHQVIEFEKDYEIAETRARQRLVASLGFNGSLLDEDEVPATGRGRSLDPAATTSPDPQEDPPDHETVEETPEAEEPTQAVIVPAAPSSDLSPQLQAQVNARVAQLGANGKTVTAPTTKSEALKFLRETAPRAVGG